MTTDLTLQPTQIGNGFSRSVDWVDAVAGGKFQFALTPKLVVTVLGDAGGGSARSDYQIAGLLGYKVGRKCILQAGYRYLDVNYRVADSFATPPRRACCWARPLMLGELDLCPGKSNVKINGLATIHIRYGRLVMDRSERLEGTPPDGKGQVNWGKESTRNAIQISERTLLQHTGYDVFCCRGSLSGEGEAA